MDAKEHILMSLPDTFSRSDFLDEVGHSTGYSLSHADYLLKQALFKGKIRRVEFGRYEKVKQPKTATA